MRFENVTCPHCGLLCDDLTVEVNDLSLEIVSPRSSHCQTAFADASLEINELPTAKIEGRPASVEDALKKASDILKKSSQPLINGLIADVQTCRSAIALAEKAKGVIDHANGARIRCSSKVMQRFGEVKTTLAEVRNRADCIVILGSGVLERFPGLVDRVLSPDKTLGSNSTTNKKIFVLDLATKNNTKQKIEENNITTLFFDFPLLESLAYRFQEIITRPKNSISISDDDTQTLLDLETIILQSNYTTLIWSAADFKQESSEHTVQALTETIKYLMNNIRCVGLPLGGSKGEITANQVCTWQTGVALPVSFMEGIPKHDPLLYDGMTMLQNNENDSLMWIATYNSKDIPPKTDVPTIVVGHPKMNCEGASVYIPVGIPGIDYRGLACRTDSVATLPLHVLRSGTLPSASEILNNLINLI